MDHTDPVTPQDTPHEFADLAKRVKRMLKVKRFFEFSELPCLTDGNKQYLYIAALPGRLKIGIAMNPSHRLSRLQNAIGARFEKVWCVGPLHLAAAVESGTHSLLHRDRGIGEWFNVGIDTAIVAVEEAMRRVVNEWGEVVELPGEYNLPDPPKPKKRIAPRQIEIMKKSQLSDEYWANRLDIAVEEVVALRGYSRPAYKRKWR